MFLRFGLCAVISVYVPSFCSMCLHLALCAFISLYVPSSHSMDLHPALCAVILFYGPSVPLTKLTSQIHLYPTATLTSPLPHTHLTSIKLDRKSTRLNSSHVAISYAVFC